MARRYHKECEFQQHMKDSRVKEENKRDTFETQRCQSLFQEQCEAARRAEIAKREMLKRVAEENMMLASNRKRQEVTERVQENMKRQQEIINNKVTV